MFARGWLIRSGLVDAGRALPVEHVNQLPGVLVKFDLELSFFVNRKLGQGKQHAGALFLVLFIQVKLTCRKVKGNRLVTKRIFLPLGVGIMRIYATSYPSVPVIEQWPTTFIRPRAFTRPWF